MAQFSAVEQETIVGNVNLANNRDYNHGVIYRDYWYKEGAVAPKRAWGPVIFITKFKFL